jgi:hypothetical protein
MDNTWRVYPDNTWRVYPDNVMPMNPEPFIQPYNPLPDDIQYPYLDLNEWWRNYYTPVWRYIYPSIPIVQEDKMAKAFKIAKVILDKVIGKKVLTGTFIVKDFIEMVELIVKEL